MTRRLDEATSRACARACLQYGKAVRMWSEDETKPEQIRQVKPDALPIEVLGTVVWAIDRIERARAAELTDPEPEGIGA